MLAFYHARTCGMLQGESRATSRTRLAAATGETYGKKTPRKAARPRALRMALPHGILETGASIYDFGSESMLFSQPFAPEFIDEIVRVFGRHAVPFQPFAAGRGALEAGVLDRLEALNMADFRELFEQTARFVPDTLAFAREHREQITKINSWHPSLAARPIRKEREARVAP